MPKSKIDTIISSLLPDTLPPLDQASLAFKTKELLQALGAPPDATASLTVNTMKYYRAQNIISPPLGATTNAAFGRRNVLEAATARLGGHLRMITITDRSPRPPQMAAHTLRDMSEARLTDCLRTMAESLTPALQPPAPPPRRETELLALNLAGGAILLIPKTLQSAVNSTAIAGLVSTVNTAIAVYNTI